MLRDAAARIEGVVLVSVKKTPSVRTRRKIIIVINHNVGIIIFIIIVIISSFAVIMITVVCETKRRIIRRGGRKERLAFKTPNQNQGLQSSFCCWIAGQRLTQSFCSQTPVAKGVMMKLGCSRPRVSAGNFRSLLCLFL